MNAQHFGTPKGLFLKHRKDQSNLVFARTDLDSWISGEGWFAVCGVRGRVEWSGYFYCALSCAGDGGDVVCGPALTPQTAPELTSNSSKRP